MENSHNLSETEMFNGSLKKTGWLLFMKAWKRVTGAVVQKHFNNDGISL